MAPDPPPAVVNTRDRTMRTLIRQIKALGAEIKNIRGRGFAAVASAVDRSLFRGMFATVGRTYEQFMAKWEEVIVYAEDKELVPAFPDADEENYLAEIRNYYYEIQSYYIQIETKAAGPRSSNVHDFSFFGDQSSLNVNGPKAILPKIPIKTFQGDVTRWPTFKQLFTSLIKEDQTLTDAQRFHYLTSYLEGPAYDTIRHITAVGENFEQAWAALVKVYDDPRQLARTYLDRFLSYKSPPGKPTVASLQSYLSSVAESVSSIRNLPIPNLAEYLLCELALRSLDPATRELFETAMVTTTFPCFPDLQTFVQQRCQVLSHIQGISPIGGPTSSGDADNSRPLLKPPNKFLPKTNKPALMAHGSEEIQPASDDSTSSCSPRATPSSCYLCQGDHELRLCSRFVPATPAQRLNLLRRFPGCRNCLRVDHKSHLCQSKNACGVCKRRHHTDLHLPLPAQAEGGNGTPTPSTTSGPAAPSGFVGANTRAHAGVLLGTVLANIRDSQGRLRLFRGVLDPGSMFSFITEQAARTLQKSARPFQGAISGVSDAPLRGVKGQVSLSFEAPARAEPLRTNAVIVPTITPPLPLEALHSEIWGDYQSYELSDAKFTEPGPISFLIGADLFTEVIIGAPITLLNDGPRLLPTIFGYSVIGRYLDEMSSGDGLSLLTCTTLDSLIERFWLIEEPSLPAVPSPEEVQCESHFCSTHSRGDDGRYVVSLPFKSSPPELVPSTSRVLSCLYALEARFARNEALRKAYIAQMEEYKELGHMRLATDPARYLIPHHAVFKQEGERLKLRVVFDASFPTPGGSLNDHLLTGPKLQADIGQILLRFRRHAYVFRCDIVKMFRQIWLNPRDRCYQQIMWRNSPAEPVQLYELTTVSFGMSSSPYLAQRVLRQHALNYQQQYPEAAQVLLRGAYVDDLVAGSDDPEHLCRVKTELIGLLSLGGFELGKWNANHPSLLESPDLTAEVVSLRFEDAPVTKILGMKWDPSTDAFSYEVFAQEQKYTKRAIHSTIARLYDPLGYLAPIVFYAKCIQQHTWQLPQVGWDDLVPADVQESWRLFLQDLPAVSRVSIPRALPQTDTSYQLVCFCDASASGYCANAYLRSTLGTTATLTLLKAKTKVAPLKPLTIPRLELCGALLLSRVVQSLDPLVQDLGIDQFFCFTDSTTVLAWLHILPHLLQTFVSNRVQKVLSSTKLEWWHHIKGVENPADVGSRGIAPADLKDHALWWSGPDWCRLPLSKWPVSAEVPAVEVPEVKTPRLALISVKGDSSLVEYAKRHSSYLRFVRTIAYLKRFSFNTRLPKPLRSHRRVGPISPQEFREADGHFLRLLQHSYYANVFTHPFNQLPPELRRLNVFVDAEGLIRVGGRLKNAPIAFEHKHPVLLPARSYYTNLVVEHHHRKNHHIGPTALLAAIHQSYWIPKARNLVKLIRHRCPVCVRFSKSSVIPLMGQLPRSRFAGVRPFLITGVDFAGPFIFKMSTLRKSQTDKAYLCLFICMSSRALHLEVATSLSVEGFLDAFDRFIARRGLPAEMLSDGGTNFRGTDRYLRELSEYFKSSDTEASLVQQTAHLNLSWNFNPPSSPHFGGGWEVAVRVVKDLFYKTFGNHPYTLPELHTAFTKIEGILNSRPIQALSSSPEDLEPLTPGHFLIGQPLTALPEPDFQDIPEGRLNRWQRIRERTQFFWARWKQEYLHGLQLRQKWNKQAPNLKIGDLVLLRDENTPPTQWPMGRVLEVHPGDDGVVRVVSLKTPTGIYKRPAVKMVPLLLRDIHQP